MTMKAAIGLDIWTICERPSDFPDSFTARCHSVTSAGSEPTGLLLVADDIETLRKEMIRRGLTCISREPGDDPVIVESWL
ncbi:hypothetical protein ELH77_19170 [Rhizobium ruizarguesonis]|uniref:hypothetical protein n=1 Tax=Rhizobium ruizarguesonis TaxID=2081791 RepID=UPI0010313815|nr:hypothetical protein [Rhizobium ruizarguesonis]TAZ20728.1 hypothetical protein ELH77_19170 [Rhizobium ruizarguesonis]